MPRSVMCFSEHLRLLCSCPRITRIQQNSFLELLHKDTRHNTIIRPGVDHPPPQDPKCTSMHLQGHPFILLLSPPLRNSTSVTSQSVVACDLQKLPMGSPYRVKQVAYDLQDSTLLQTLTQICNNITFNDSSGNPLVCQGFAYDSFQQVAFFKGQAANTSIDQSYLCHQPNVTLWLLNAGQLSTTECSPPAGIAL